MGERASAGRPAGSVGAVDTGSRSPSSSQYGRGERPVSAQGYPREMPRVTSKGQGTTPVAVRFALGIGPGDDVVFAVEGGRGVFRRADGALGRAGALGGEARQGAHPLERLLLEGDDAF